MIIGAVFGAQRLVFASGIETFISTDSELYHSFQRYARDFGSDPIMVVLRGDTMDDLIQTPNLEAMGQLADGLQDNEAILSVLSPLTVFQETMATDAVPTPDELKDLVLDPTTGGVRPEFKSIFPDEEHTLILISLQSDISLDEMSAITDEVSGLMANITFSGVTAHLTGTPVLSSQIDDMLYSNLRNTLILSVGLMLLVLATLFSVRGIFLWRWLALGGMVISLIYAFGAMGWLNIPLTMATMAIFPILVGLGIDYGIQLHNRFDEEAGKGLSRSQAAAASVTFMGPAIGVALLAAICGIAALFFSPLPLIKDFTKMLIVGLAIAYVAALFLIPTFLRLGRTKKAVAEEPLSRGDSRLETRLRKVSSWVVTRPWLIVPLALVPAVAGLVVDSRIGIETDQSKWLREDLPVVQGFKELEELTGGISSINILVEGDITNPEVMQWMIDTGAAIQSAHPDTVSKLDSPAHLIEQQLGTIPLSSEEVNAVIEQVPLSMRQNLINSDLDAANFAITVRFMPLEDLKVLQDEVDGIIASPPAGASAIQTGWVVIETHTWLALGEGRQQMTLWSIGFVFLALLVLFRGRLLYAIIATFPMVLVVGWAALAMYLAGIKFNPLTATMGALVLGIGAEYSILVLWRYNDERSRGKLPLPAMVEAVSRLGRAILASGTTTIAGFGALLYARDFLIMRDFSIVIMLDVFLALIGSLIVMPAIMVWVDNRRLARARRQE